MSIETFTQVAGRRVIAAGTAESIGTVKGFVLDQRGGQIEAIHIDGRGKRASVLPWHAITAFGDDAVMTPSDADTSTVDGDHDQAAVKGNITMIGSRVLTTAGVALDPVDDVEFDTESGAVLRVLTSRGPIDAAALRSLGSYALVVESGAPSEDGAP